MECAATGCLLGAKPTSVDWTNSLRRQASVVSRVVSNYCGSNHRVPNYRVSNHRDSNHCAPNCWVVPDLYHPSVNFPLATSAQFR